MAGIQDLPSCIMSPWLPLNCTNDPAANLRVSDGLCLGSSCLWQLQALVVPIPAGACGCVPQPCSCSHRASSRVLFLLPGILISLSTPKLLFCAPSPKQALSGPCRQSRPAGMEDASPVKITHCMCLYVEATPFIAWSHYLHSKLHVSHWWFSCHVMAHKRHVIDCRLTV